VLRSVRSCAVPLTRRLALATSSRPSAGRLRQSSRLQRPCPVMPGWTRGVRRENPQLLENSNAVSTRGAVGAEGTARDCPYSEEGWVGHKGWPSVPSWRRASPSPNWRRASCRQATAARVLVDTRPRTRCRRGRSRVHRVWARVRVLARGGTESASTGGLSAHGGHSVVVTTPSRSEPGATAKRGSGKAGAHATRIAAA